MNAGYLLRAKSAIVYLQDDHTVRQGLEKLRAHGYTAVPVIRADGSYAGSVSEGDFLRHILKTSGDLRAQESYKIMDLIRKDWNPAVRIDVTMDALLARVMQQNFVPVVDDRNLFIGIIVRRDIIRYFVENGKLDDTDDT